MSVVCVTNYALDQLQGLLGGVPDAVLLTGVEGRLEFLNRAAEQLTRHRLNDARGRPLEEILPLVGDLDATCLESPAAACLRQRKTVGPFLARLLYRRGTRYRLVEVSAGPALDSGGAVVGAVVIARDVTRPRLEARRVAHHASYDALTGLVNREEFERRLRRAWAGAAEHGRQHILGFLDLDGFKRINDTCGHLAGDELLRQLGVILRSQMRARDTVARLGGDEFGILLEDCAPATAVRIANDLRRAVGRHRFVCGKQAHRIGASLGIVPLAGQGSPLEALRVADAACYAAKRSGGNRIELHTTECPSKEGRHK